MRGSASVSDTHSCSTDAFRDQAYSCLSTKTFSNGEWYLDNNNTCGFLNIGTISGHVGGTPSASDVGSCVASFKVVDVVNGGVLSRQSFSIDVQSPNRAPVLLTPTCSNKAAQGDNYNCVLVASDADYDDLTWSFHPWYHSCGAFLSIDSGTGEISGTPGAGDGSCVVSVRTNDGEAYSNIQSFVLYISAKPVVSNAASCPSLNINTGELWTCDLDSSDPNGSGSITWEYGSDNTCNFLSLNPATGIVTGTPAMSDLEDCVFSLKSFDGDVYSEEEVFYFDVNATPVLSHSCATSINQGDAYTCVVSATDNDAGDSLTLSDLSDCSFSTVSQIGDDLSLGGLNGELGTDTSCTARYSVDDGQKVVTEEFELTINQKPDIVCLGSSDCDLFVNEGDDGRYFDHQLTASDSEGSASFAWALDNTIANACSFMDIHATNGSFIINSTPSAGDVGSCDVAVIATDPSGLDSDPYIVTFTVNANSAPVVTQNCSGTLSSLNEDTANLCNVEATDADGHPLTWSVRSGASCEPIFSFDAGGPVESVNGATDELTSNIDLTGLITDNSISPDCNLIIDVTDGIATTSFNYTVTINAVNDPPSFENVLCSGGTEDGSLSCSFDFTDEEGNGIASYAISDDLAGAGYTGSEVSCYNASATQNYYDDPGPGYIDSSGTPTIVVDGIINDDNATTPLPGSCVLIVEMVDDDATSPATGYFHKVITLTNTNDTPTIDTYCVTPSTTDTANEDALYSCPFSGSDVDGDSLTWALTANTTCPTSAADGYPSWMEINSSTGEVTWTPADDGKALPISCDFEVVANDGTIDSAAQLITLTVNNFNEAPVADDNCPDVVIPNDGPFAGCQATGTDLDANNIFWYVEASNGCAWLSIDMAGNITGTPPAGAAPVCTFRYYGEDDHAPSATTGIVEMDVAVDDVLIIADGSNCNETSGAGDLGDGIVEIDEGTTYSSCSPSLDHARHTAINSIAAEDAVAWDITYTDNSGAYTDNSVGDRGCGFLNVVEGDNSISLNSNGAVTQDQVDQVFCEVDITGTDGGVAGTVDTYNIRYEMNNINDAPVAIMESSPPQSSDCGDYTIYRDDTSTVGPNQLASCLLTQTDEDNKNMARDTITWSVATTSCGLRVDTDANGNGVVTYDNSGSGYPGATTCDADFVATDGMAFSNVVSFTITFEERPVIDAITNANDCTVNSVDNNESFSLQALYECQLSASSANGAITGYQIDTDTCSGFTIDNAGKLERLASVTSGSPGYCEVFVTATDAIGEVSAPMEITFLMCPKNYTYVAGGAYNDDFCVMQHEAKAVNDSTGAMENTGLAADRTTHTPVSMSAAYPWRDITQSDAVIACQKNGSDYNLISNNQWQQLAQELEAQAQNWSSGAVGTGCIFTGNSGYDYSCGYNQGSVEGDGLRQDLAKITLLTSSGAEVYDFSGNVWEWVNDNQASLAINAKWPSVTDAYALSTFGPGQNYADPSPTGFADTISYYGGLGIADLDSATLGIVRGGSFNNTTGTTTWQPGIFATSLDYADDGMVKDPNVGFRCVFNP